TTSLFRGGSGYPRRPWTLKKASIRVNRLILDECFSGGALTAAGSWFFHAVRAAHGSGTHDVLVLASNPEGGDAAFRRTALISRHSRCLSSGRSHACCGVVRKLLLGCADAARTRRRGNPVKRALMSAYGTNRTCQHVCALSAFGGKADIAT